MVEVITALSISFGLVSAYYAFMMAALVAVQKWFHYDKPQGLFHKAIDFPVSLPGFIFDLVVPNATKLRHFNLKRGYLKKEFLCFIANVVIYFIPIYAAFASADHG